MELLTSLEELEGKTILSATDVDGSEGCALLFADNTYAVFRMRYYGEDMYELELSYDVHYSMKFEAGVISEEEYTAIVEAEEADRKKRHEEYELKQLEKLKAKYPDA